MTESHSPVDYQDRIAVLRSEHRDLDQDINRLEQRNGDQFQLQRMKRRKLRIKDQITQLESKLIPNLNA